MTYRLALALALAACSGSEDTSGSDPGADAAPGPDPSPDTYRLEVPSFTLQPGEENTYCYYTTLGNAEAIGVGGYSSQMAPGSHHLILYTYAELPMPEGTLVECSGVRGQSATPPVWAYAAQEPEATTRFPDGVGVGFAAHQPVMVNAHYLNTSDAPLTTSIRIDVEAKPAGATYTTAAAFVTFNNLIEVPPGESASVSGSCAVPSGAQFFLLSTHSHKFTHSVQVHDGASLLLETDDWEHPTVGQWDADPFMRFASGRLDYRCDYDNPTSSTVVTGDSAQTDEMCMAVGYFFPASRNLFCLNSTISLEVTP